MLGWELGGGQVRGWGPVATRAAVLAAGPFCPQASLHSAERESQPPLPPRAVRDQVSLGK